MEPENKLIDRMRSEIILQVIFNKKAVEAMGLKYAKHISYMTTKIIE